LLPTAHTTRINAVLPVPSLIAHRNSEPRGAQNRDDVVVTDLRGIVRIDEESDLLDLERGPVLTGLFTAQHVVDEVFVLEEIEHASVDDAVAWGRERAEVVTVCVAEREYFTAGVRPAGKGYEPWVPGLRLSRRRTPREEWRDRQPNDPTLSWRVYVDLEASGAADRASDEDVARVADAAHAARWARGRVADHDPDAASWAGTVEFVGMDTVFSAMPMFLSGDTPLMHDPRRGSWRLEFDIEASTASQAMQEALSRCAVSHWSAEAMAIPLSAVPGENEP
jgi:hypothetical protein